MLTEKTFKEQISGMLTYLKTSLTELTIKQYYDALQKISDDDFNKAVKYLYSSWKYPHFPLIADFVAAYKAIKPTESTYKPQPRDDNAFNPMTQIKEIRFGLKCQDIIKKQLLQPIYGSGFDSGFDCGDKRDKLRVLMAEKIKANECFSLQNERWGKRENAVITGNYYFQPEKFGW